MKRTAQEELPPGGEELTPLEVDTFRSIGDLRDALIRMGPTKEAYDRMFDLIGHEETDEVKPAIASFFGGSPTALCFLYRKLVEAGRANAIDEDIVAEITQMHPELTPDEPQDEKKAAGLFLPCMTKEASGFTGGPNSGEKYVMHGPSQTRVCPKLRDLVSTHICRFHCLDGLTIDDAETQCGEAIWRQAVMDKFSRDYKDADGKLVGGYLRKRFLIDQQTHGNDYQLRPGQRARPIGEQAWSTEKRLAEMRREHGDDRGYRGVHEPDDLYNFDQHEIAAGPDNVQLDAKERDELAKNAAAGRRVKVADSMFPGDPFNPDEPEIEEFEGDYVPPEEREEVMQAMAGVPDPGDVYMVEGDDLNWYRWGEGDAPPELLHTGGAAELPGVLGESRPRILRMNLDGKVEADITDEIFPPTTTASRGFNLARRRKLASAPRKKTFNLRRTRTAAGLGGDGDPLVSKEENPAPRGKTCTSCAKTHSNEAEACSNCGAPLVETSRIAFKGRAMAVEKPKIMAGGEPEITYANGVYRARVGRLSAFADTAEKAEMDLAAETTPTIDALSEEIYGEMQEDVPAPEQPVPEPPPEPAHVDAADLDAAIVKGRGDELENVEEGEEGELDDVEDLLDLMGAESIEETPLV
jgi:hypothetical protein